MAFQFAFKKKFFIAFSVADHQQFALPQFAMTEGHSIWDVTKSLFATYCCAETVHYDWRPQYLRCHREAICNLLQPKFNMAEGHSIWDVTERLYATYCSQSSIWLKVTVFEFLNIDNLFSTWADQYFDAHICLEGNCYCCCSS